METDEALSSTKGWVPDAESELAVTLSAEAAPNEAHAQVGSGHRHAPPLPLASEVGGKLPKGGAAEVLGSVGVVVGQYEEARARLAGQLREVEATLVGHLDRLPASPFKSFTVQETEQQHEQGERGGHQQQGSVGATTIGAGLDDSREEMSFEEQFRSLNAKLLSAEERIKRKSSFAKLALAGDNGNDAHPSAASPRGSRTDHDGAVVPQAVYDKLEEEKSTLEEELWDLRFQYEEEQRKVFALTSEKEALEHYVTQLAEEMQKETANMVSMKEQFEEQTSPAGRRSVARRLSRAAAAAAAGEEGGAAEGPEAEASGGARFPGAGEVSGAAAAAAANLMDAETLAVEVALKDEELRRMRESMEREKRRLEGEVVSLKFDLQKLRNELNVREGKMASVKLELEKGRKRVEAVELERKALADGAARAQAALSESHERCLASEAAERAARAQCEALAQRVAAGEAEIARLRQAHEEAAHALAAQAQAQAQAQVQAGGREALLAQVEERVRTLQHEWERLREREASADSGAGALGGGDSARWAVEEFVRELQGQVARAEQDKAEMQLLQRQAKEELQHRIRKLERERDDERERARDALDRVRTLEPQLQAATEAAEKDRHERRAALEAQALLTERLSHYEALAKGDLERGQHLFLERERELRQAADDKETQRRKLETEAIMLRVELQRAQLQVAEAAALAAQLSDLREQLAQAHSREGEDRATIGSLEERLRVAQERHDTHARERDLEEIRAKDRRIAQLTADLAGQAQVLSSQQEMHAASLQALKTQNTLLTRELERLEEQQRETIKEKEESSRHLQAELLSLRQAYKTLLQKQQQDQAADTSSTARRDQEKDAALNSLREELENVKRDLFYTTAVGIKLNLTYSGRSCNINTGALYEKALAEGVRWQHWNRWIHDQAERGRS